MLRQSGTSALRLINLQQAANGNRLLSTAMMGTRGAASELAAAEAPCSGVATQASVAQFSPAAAAALANKAGHIVGMGGASLKPTNKAFGTFASRAASTSAAPAAAAAAAEEKPSMLRRLAKAVAAVAGALMLATTVSADSPEPYQWFFQDMATSTGQAMVDLHHDIMFFLIVTATLVLYMLFQITTKFHYSRQLMPEKLTHHTTLEVIWTIIPTLIVLSIAVPSLTLIYSMDQHTDRPGLTVKVIGRQWYWSYEMHDHLQQKLLDPERLVAIAEKSVLKA